MNPIIDYDEEAVKIQACIWSPESFLQNQSKTGAKMTNFAIPQYIKI